MKVKIKNFQRIRHADIEFVDGINVITGRNGSGKSALFRAIKAVLLNPKGSAGYINFNADQARVTIENEDACLTWIREKGTSSYLDEKTGRPYPKASTIDSRDIADLGFYFDAKNKLVSLHDQWSVLFPFGESDTEMFKLFEDMFNFSSCFEVVNSFKQDEDCLKKQDNLLKLDIEHCQERIKKVNHALGMLDLQQLRDYKNKLAEYDKLVPELDTDLSKAVASENILKYRLPEKLDSNKILDFQSLENVLAELNADIDKANKCLALINFDLSMIDKSKLVLPDLSFYNDLVEDMKVLTYNNNIISECQRSIDNLNKEKHDLEEQWNSLDCCPICGNKLEKFNLEEDYGSTTN